ALLAHGPFGADGGALAMSRLLDTAHPTGVICASDLMAMGAMGEAARRGLDVPHDLSVVGFDDIALAAYWSPPLTTLAQPIRAMAAATIDELVVGLAPEPRAGHPPASRIFRADLVKRGSTAAPG
ncbi:MAG: substrate-binding domain-containing protein, partial [Actinomycetota bacterium]|nr:substrate-binding domain-containing protein [Actinomycetota bacterium]